MTDISERALQQWIREELFKENSNCYLVQFWGSIKLYKLQRKLEIYHHYCCIVTDGKVALQETFC